MYINNVSGLEEQSCPYPSEVCETVTADRHEKSLRGTQASREAESHRQEANVTEISHGQPVIGEPKYPCGKGTTTRRGAIREYPPV